MRRKRTAHRSISQETCSLPEEKLPKKAQFLLIRESYRSLIRMSAFRKAGIFNCHMEFSMWNVPSGYRHSVCINPGLISCDGIRLFHARLPRKKPASARQIHLLQGMWSCTGQMFFICFDILWLAYIDWSMWKTCVCRIDLPDTHIGLSMYVTSVYGVLTRLIYVWPSKNFWMRSSVDSSNKSSWTSGNFAFRDDQYFFFPLDTAHMSLVTYLHRYEDAFR